MKRTIIQPEIFYVEQYRHRNDSPLDTKNGPCWMTKFSLDNMIKESKRTNHITVAVWTIKLKPNAAT